MKIVLLHGFLESNRIWDDIKTNLNTDFEIITPDLLGHGKAPVISKIHTMEMMAEALNTQFAENSDEKYLLVGHSMGGYVALAFAEKFTEKVSGIVLMNSTPLPDSDEKKANRERVAKAIDAEKSFFIKSAITSLFSDKNKVLFENELTQLIDIAMQTPNEGIKSASLGMKERPNRTDLLKSLSIPKHFIIGKNDGLIPYQDLINIANETKASYWVVDGGHLAYIENKNETIETLNHFIQKVTKNH